MGYFFSYILALGAALGVASGWIFTFLGLGLIFGLNMGLDEWIKDREIPPGFWRDLLFYPRLSEVALLISFPFLVLFLGFSLWQIIGLRSSWEILGAVLSVGSFMGLIGINAAHELIHRRPEWQKALGVLNLALVNFCWYRISHIEIHHRWVGTSKDCSTARSDENFWTFAVRCFWGSLRGSAALEFSKNGWGVRNRMWSYAGLSVGFGVLIYLAGEALAGQGLLSLGAWLAISAVAILMLKSADYIEHKGLVRAEVSDGRFEPVRAGHSFDSYHLITNFSLFNLGYHSNHHLKAALPFTVLGRVDGAARMPSGYALMVLRSILGLH